MILQLYLRSLVVKGWKFWLKDGALAYRAVKDQQTKAILTRLKEHKLALMEILNERPQVLMVAPVSDGQLSYWIQWQRQPDDASAHVPFSLRIRSTVEPDKLHQAINGVMARHDALRAFFVFEHGELIQQILPASQANAQFNVFDVSGQDEDSVREQVIDGHKEPFDLEKCPPVRLALYRFSTTHHVLMLSIHHAVIDGLSHGIVLEQFISDYEALCRGKPVDITPAAVPYSDYAHWQKRFIGGDAWQKMEDYWHQSLSGAQTLLQLPQKPQTDGDGLARRSVYRVDLNPQQYQRLVSFTRQIGATKYTTLLAAFQAVLYRYSGQRDLLIGSPLLGRTDHRFADVVGYFINTVVLRARMDDGLSFTKLVKQTESQTLGAIENQDYLFSALIDKLKPERHPGVTPFFQAWFNLNKYWQFKKSSQQLSGTSESESSLVMERFSIGGQEANFNLVLHMEDDDKQLTGEIKYNAKLYDDTLIANLGDDFLRLLDSVMDNAEQGLGQIVLAEDERKAAAQEAINNGFSLSLQQSRIWQQRHLLTTDGVMFGLHWMGKVERRWVKSAVERVLGRHEIFSTRFVSHPLLNSLLQTIDHDNLQWHDLPGSEQLSAPEVWALAKNHQHDDHQQPLLDGFLVEGSEQQTLLLIKMHPMYVDGTLAEALSSQIVDAYQGVKNGSGVDDDDPVQYLDIAQWAKEHLDSVDGEPSKAFWQEVDLTNNQISPLRLDHQGIDIHRFTAKSAEPLRLGAVAQDKLTALATAMKVPVEQWLFGAWQIYLNRLSGYHTHLVGKRFDGRPDEDTATVVGPLARFLPVPSYIVKDECLSQLLARNRAFIADAEQHQECFVWPESAPQNHQLTHLPYQFEYDLMTSHWQVDGCDIQLMPFAAHNEAFNLKLSCLHDSENQMLGLTVHYNRDSFTDSCAQLMSEQFAAMLDNLLDAPQTVIAELDIICDSQLSQILGFNHETEDFGHGLAIHQLIRQKAEQLPDKIALQCQNHRHSFADLNNLSAQYAKELCQAGVKNGDYVGVFARHSSETVIAMLAILNVGGVYVPLDVEYPAERLQYIIDDCQLKLAFVGPEFSGLSLDGRSLESQVKTIGLTKQRLAQMPAYPSNGAVAPDAPAYLIYTSGSTGNPKGTLVSHQALVSHAFSVAKRFEITTQDVVLLFAPFNFDPSIEQCLPPLMHGAKVQVKETGLWQPSDIAGKIKHYGLTVVNFPTAFWHLLVQHWQHSLDPNDVKTLRLVIPGGDKLLLDMAQTWWNLGLDKVRLFNAYGPTETTITASTADVAGPDCLALGRVAIGRPLCNRVMYILDPMLKPVPVGCEGELYIGGASLANGYLNQPHMTEQAFVADPFCPEGKARMYKTGDRTFFDEVGNVYFVGRIDSQVKIRGYRIEPMEIEQRVNQLAQVREAAVIIRQQGDDQDNKQIVVCYVAKRGADIDNQLREYLAKQLPEYMMPHLFVSLDHMPLNPSGKFDRKQLALVAQTNKTKAQRVDPPTSQTEITLAQIWLELLGVEQVNRHDHFSQMGGHSLLFMKLLAQIGDKFSVNLKLKDVFDASDLATQAELIDRVCGDDKLSQVSLVSVDKQQPLPISYAQESMWLLSNLGLGMSYQMAGVLHFTTPLNIAVLQQCIDVLVARHDALRTVFSANEGDIYQQILPEVKLAIEQLECDRKAIDSVLGQWQSRAFDFAEAPLMRVLLLSYADGGQTLGLCMHHIVCDGFSTNILLQEMADIYNALVGGESVDQLSCLDELPIQYPDYAVWQRQMLTEAVIERDLTYWQQQLKGYQDLDILPCYSRPEQQSGKGQRLNTVIDADVDVSLQQLCKKLGVSQTAILVAAVHLLLSRYSQNNDFCLGMPTACRDRVELEGVVGMLVNILVVRLGCQAPQTSIVAYLEHTHDVIQHGLMHLELPFDKVVEHLKPPRDLGRNPIFQVLISYIEFSNLFRFDDQEVTFNGIDAKQSRFDLSFDFGRDSLGALVLAVEYSTDLFSDRFVQSMVDNLNHTLRQLAHGHFELLSQLSPVDPQHQQQQLAWGKGPVIADANPANAHIIDLIDHHCLTRGNATALSCNDDKLSYQQFNATVNDIAACLQGFGAKAGDFVGVGLERSLNTSLAMIAIIKIGAVYIPIDPTLPQARIRYIAKDSGINIILTDQHSVGVFEPILCGDGRLVVLGQAGALPDEVDVSSPAAPVVLAPDNPAYIIYTSGSTGNPKGVVISLGAVTHCMYAMRDVVDFVHHDSMLAVATTSFDISVLDLLLPLCFGGELIIADNDTIKNADALSAMIARRIPTLMQATPVTWQMLFEFGWSNPTDTRLLSIGEPISAKLQQMFEQHQCRIVNGYGPTEATIYATAKWLTPGCRISIGQPIGNYQVYVHDEAGQMVPMGVPGELIIGGPALGLGYHNKPELTAQVFVENPLCVGERWYKTGDLVRWIEQDGQMELDYISRLDQQVKLRGYRIELEEIEAALDNLGLFSQTAVVLKETAVGPQLVGYLVAQTPDETAEAAVDIEQVKSRLGESLPGYMVPTHLIMLDEMPLTPNKKLDKKRLRQLALVIQDSVGYVGDQPSSETEQQLLGIWKNLFNSDMIGVLDNIFHLGGHSLLLVNLQSRIQQTFAVQLPLASLFKLPMLKDMAAEIDRLTGHLMWQINPVDTPQRVQMSYNQQGLWLVDQVAGGTSDYNVLCGIGLNGDIRPPLLLKAWQQVQQRQQSLRTRFEFEQGKAFGRVHEQLLEQLPVIDLTEFDSEQQRLRVDEQIKREFGHVFDLAENDLFRLHLYQMGKNDYVMLINLHHIIVDGWSIRLLIGEILTIYDALLGGREPVLPPLPVQYVDFAYWQRTWMEQGGFDEQLTYWRKQLNNSPALSALPFDHDFPTSEAPCGAVINADFDDDSVAPLRRFAIAQSTTLFTVMLSCWKMLLFMETGKTDIVLGIDVANRVMPELEGVMGFFMDQVPLRSQLKAQASVGEFIAQVSHNCIEAFANQDIPFEQLVSKLEIERTPGLTPIFQGKFFMDNLPEVILVGDNFDLQPMEIEQEAARLALNFSLVDTGKHIKGKLVYNSRVFELRTIERMLQRYRQLLEKIPQCATLSVTALIDALLESESQAQVKAREALMKRKLGRLRSKSGHETRKVNPLTNTTDDQATDARKAFKGRSGRRKVSAGELAMLSFKPLNDKHYAPLVISPNAPQVDIIGWLADNPDKLKTLLLEHGAVLFRGFDLATVERVSQVAQLVMQDIFNENTEHQPVTNKGDVQIPVDYAKDQFLLWHNENTFNLRWPQKVIFACAKAATLGGETPLVDSRAIYEQLDGQIRQQFIDKQVMYVRKYGPNDHVGLGWKTIFKTSDKAKVEQQCAAQKMQCEWLKDDHLLTRAVRPAVWQHPVSGQWSWCNQAQHWHNSCLATNTRMALAKIYKNPLDYPRNCFFGDGSIIPDSVMNTVLQLYRDNHMEFVWQQGDLVLVDNILKAHARNAYQGERKILVCFGDMGSF